MAAPVPWKARDKLPVRVVGIETALPVGGIALADGGKVAVHCPVPAERCSESLLAELAGALESAGWGPESLDGVAVSIGPGSFTGLRVGMAAAKSLAWARGIPIAGVGTMEALAFAAPSSAQLICTLVPARPGEVYAALFRRESTLEMVHPPRPVAPGQVAELLPAGEGEVWLVGDGAEACRPHLPRDPGLQSIRVCPLREAGAAAGVALLGSRRLARGEADDPASLAPVYLKKSEAEIRWQNRPGKN
ncbi:MAG: tRNA (adenosine(37)-N6)-threonylcarbamoyltransferase complex dimerization subunit type 1 TsaB [Firmicutes bacterium]|nr:tRNA (adenosine(37)-N6)-threonylcarbamoyltransferase complex dimerization subunit type 1 TsaB [Bacillota bacterium]